MGKYEMCTEVIRASELDARVIFPIALVSDPELQEELQQFRTDFRRYKRRLGKKEEEVREIPSGPFGLFKREVIGFAGHLYGQEIFVERPRMPQRRAYFYTRYYPGLSNSSEGGVLVDSLFNRDIRHQRVEQYKADMEAGNWRDFVSDPITITEDGQVINGQHRLAAATDVDWSEVSNDPLFLVVWGVDPLEALYADMSRRTERDQATIAHKLLTPSTNGDEEEESATSVPDTDGLTETQKMLLLDERSWQ